MFDRLTAFLGKPLPFHGISVYSPTIDEITDKGWMNYRIHLILATFDKENILLHLFGLAEEEYEQLADKDSYELLTSNLQIAQHIATALSFFVRSEVSYRPEEHSFASDDTVFLDQSNYQEWIATVQQLNGVGDQEKPQHQFKNARAKRIYNNLQQQKRKVRSGQQDALELKDILSILCSAEGNAISVFNAGRLSIYQAYEQFERLSLNHKRETLLPVWANGYLGEGEKLPELFIKTNL